MTSRVPSLNIIIIIIIIIIVVVITSCFPNTVDNYSKDYGQLRLMDNFQNVKLH